MFLFIMLPVSSYQPIATSRTRTSQLNHLTHTHTHTHKENTATYADGSPDTDFGQAQKGGGIKPINGIPILPFLITEISSCNLL